MFLFLRLLLAHFIGDYCLQTNRIYRKKTSGIQGLILHVSLVALCFVVFSWPFLDNTKMWIFIFFLSATHLIQDWIKASVLKKVENFWIYNLDQAMHIGFISTIFLTDLKVLTPPAVHNFAVQIYNDNFIILFLTAAILATYYGFYTIVFIRKNLEKKEADYSSFEKWYGIIERAAIFIFLYLGDKFIFLGLPILLGSRITFYFMFKNNPYIKKQFISPLEIFLSWAMAAITFVIMNVIYFKILT